MESQFSLSEERQMSEEREFLAAFSLLTPGGQKRTCLLPFLRVKSSFDANTCLIINF